MNSELYLVYTMKLRVMFRKLPYALPNAKQLKLVARQCEPYNNTNVVLCIGINRLLITLLISFVYERALMGAFNAMLSLDVWSMGFLFHRIIFFFK